MNDQHGVRTAEQSPSPHPHGRRMFQARGSRNGSPVWVRWRDGALEGDPPTTDLIITEAEIGLANKDDPMLDRQFATQCQAVDGPPLENPQFVYSLVQRVFDNVREVSSSPPGLIPNPTTRRS